MPGPDPLEVSALVTNARGGELPDVRGFPIWSGRVTSLKGWLGAFEVEWEQTNPIDLDVCRAMHRLDVGSDAADRLIAATSLAHRAPLVTRDRALRRSRVVPLAG